MYIDKHNNNARVLSSDGRVILVNEHDEVVGSMEKMEAHQKKLLHRAFSIFLFNKQGQVLIHQRAEGKYHSAGLWTNTCCSHPKPGEDVLTSARKRLQQEMGIDAELQNAFTFIYKADVGNGLTEHEFDHVLTGMYEGTPYPDPDEVQDWQWFQMDDLANRLKTEPEIFTSWFRIALPKMQDHLKRLNS